jgi:hypothetical protein
VIETLDAGIVEDQDERRSLGIITRGTAEKTFIVIRDQQSDQSQGRDVDQGDTVENK